MSGKPEEGLNDPDLWRERWHALHVSDEFDGELGVLAYTLLTSADFEEGLGSVTLDVDDGNQRVDVEVKYFMEQFPEGRILHVLSILSPGDPRPPFAT